MSIYKRHFRVTSGPLIEEAKRIAEQIESARQAWIPFIERIGAKQWRYWSDGSFAGLGFEQEPDTSIYRRDRRNSDIWIPRKNSKAGKALLDEISALPKSESIQNALRVVDLYPGIPALIDHRSGRWYGPAMGGMADKEIWFVEIPWRDEDPAVLEKYKNEKAAGISCDCELDHLLWQPPADWEEIKHWQYLKEWEELTGNRPNN